LHQIGIDMLSSDMTYDNEDDDNDTDDNNNDNTFIPIIKKL